MSYPEIQILNYYRKLNAYLHGASIDPGDFLTGNSCDQSYQFEVTVTSTIPEAYQWLYRRLGRFVDQHPALIQNIIVHGSYGDFTNNNYSDLDIVLYLKQSVVEDRKKRQQLQRLIQRKFMSFIYSIDPLQHHGVFLLWPGLVDCYVESILPLVVYTRAWSIRKFDVGFRCTAQKTPRRTPGLMQTIYSESRHTRSVLNFYYMKRLTSHIMMVPCIYFMDQGTYLYKASSFKPFIQKFRQTARLLTDVTEIRSRWPGKAWPVILMGQNNIGYRIFGKYYPSVCGALYRSRWIQNRIRRLHIDALSEVENLTENAIS
jgi:hypothetical protein